MSGKLKSVYVCSECGYESAKWFGKCSGCGAWNTLEERVQEPVSASRKSISSKGLSMPFSAMPIREISLAEEPRYCTGVSELVAKLYRIFIGLHKAFPDYRKGRMKTEDSSIS